VVFDALAIVYHARWREGYKLIFVTQNWSNASASIGQIRVDKKKHFNVARKVQTNPNTFTAPISKVENLAG